MNIEATLLPKDYLHPNESEAVGIEYRADLTGGTETSMEMGAEESNILREKSSSILRSDNFNFKIVLATNIGQIKLTSNIC
jgi:hypothetical protein